VTANFVHLSNAQASDMPVWLEPWCDELNLRPREVLTLLVEGDDEGPEIEFAEDLLVIYGAGGTRLQVLIDDVKQDTGSAVLTAPGGGDLSTRDFVGMVFGNFPETRPGGAPLPSPRPGFFARLLSRGKA
jgi:hypothetical protein